MTPADLTRLRRDIPSAILYLREQLSVSQEGLARILDVGTNSINRWENRKYKPNPRNRKKVIELLETTVQAAIARQKRVLGN